MMFLGITNVSCTPSSMAIYVPFRTSSLRKRPRPEHRNCTLFDFKGTDGSVRSFGIKTVSLITKIRFRLFPTENFLVNARRILVTSSWLLHRRSARRIHHSQCQEDGCVYPGRFRPGFGTTYIWFRCS